MARIIDKNIPKKLNTKPISEAFKKWNNVMVKEGNGNIPIVIVSAQEVINRIENQETNRSKKIDKH